MSRRSSATGASSVSSTRQRATRRTMTDWLTGSYGAGMGGTGTGIVAMRSTADGTLEVVGTVDGTASAALLLAHGDHLYAVIESETEGFVQSWRRVDDRLELDGRAPTGGTSACHVVVY